MPGMNKKSVTLMDVMVVCIPKSQFSPGLQHGMQPHPCSWDGEQGVFKISGCFHVEDVCFRAKDSGPKNPSEPRGPGPVYPTSGDAAWEGTREMHRHSKVYATVHLSKGHICFSFMPVLYALIWSFPWVLSLSLCHSLLLLCLKVIGKNIKKTT